MMAAYLGFIALLLGAVIGSFLNALSFRLNTGRGMGGRSRCMRCGHTLASFDLMPVVSYALLRGRCRYCRARISLQYPLVELTAACLSLASYLLYPTPLAFAFWFLVLMTLLFVTIYDLRHHIIPWSCSGLLAALAFFSLFVSFESGGAIVVATPPLWAFLAGPVLASPLLLFSLVSRGKWMGWADGALELSLGWLLGLSQGTTALMLAFWTGAAVGMLLLVLKKGITMKSELPFAPFLILGALMVLFAHVDFFASFALLW